jgi:hypothetical protein
MMWREDSAAGPDEATSAQIRFKRALACLLDAQQRKCEAADTFLAAREALRCSQAPGAPVEAGPPAADRSSVDMRLRLAKSLWVVARQHHEHTRALMAQAHEEYCAAQAAWEQDAAAEAGTAPSR